MLHKIAMPAAGKNTDELLVLSWNKEEGDLVERGDVLIEIETDKATMDVESFAKGILLKKLVEEGETATTGDIIAYIGEEGDLEQLEAETEVSSDEDDEYIPIMPVERTMVPIEPRQNQEDISLSYKASPAAKKLARDLQIDISQIASTNGISLIKYDDVATYSDHIAARDNDFELLPLSSMRKVIADRMLASVTTIPSFTAEVEVHMETLMTVRDNLNLESEVKISFNDLLSVCVTKAIEKYPLINSSYTDDGIKKFNSTHVGFAVSVENGLVVPVIKNIEKKRLREIALENRENISRARDGKLSSDKMEGGTVTISNLGMFPIQRFDAIINPPESCILALGTISKKPVWDEAANSFVPVSIMSMTGTFDHRVIDGAYGAGFLKALKDLIENPFRLLL